MNTRVAEQRFLGAVGRSYFTFSPRTRRPLCLMTKADFSHYLIAGLKTLPLPPYMIVLVSVNPSTTTWGHRASCPNGGKWGLPSIHPWSGTAGPQVGTVRVIGSRSPMEQGPARRWMCTPLPTFWGKQEADCLTLISRSPRQSRCKAKVRALPAWRPVCDPPVANLLGFVRVGSWGQQLLGPSLLLPPLLIYVGLHVSF